MFTFARLSLPIVKRCYRAEANRAGSVSFILAVLVYLLDIGLCARQLCRLPCAVPCRTWFRIPHSTFNTFTANSCIQFIDWVRQYPPTFLLSLPPLWGLCVLSNNAHKVNLTLLYLHVCVCVISKWISVHKYNTCGWQHSNPLPSPLQSPHHSQLLTAAPVLIGYWYYE